MPRELKRADLPEYTIAPPDVLTINALRIVPKPPYHVQPLDTLNIQVTPTPAEQPILGLYPVSPEGNVNLGFGYGVVDVTDKTLKQVREALQKHLKAYLKDFDVSVSLAQSEGLQQIRGDHLVRPDGSIGLGAYGSVPVSGMTIDQAPAPLSASVAVPSQTKGRGRCFRLQQQGVLRRHRWRRLWRTGGPPTEHGK